MHSNKITTILLTTLLSATVFAQTSHEDSVYLARSMMAVDSAMKSRNFINRVINYYDKAVNDESYKYDVTFGAAPFYTSSRGIGIGAIATVLYRMDSLSRRSDISAIGTVTVRGCYTLELEGNHNTDFDRIRMEYAIRFLSIPQYYWGKGFENGDNNDNRTEMTRKSFQAILKTGFKITNFLYGGPSISYDWFLGKNFDSDSLLFGASKRTSALNLGAFLTYDSRDISYNAFKGIYLSIEQRDYINFGNEPFFKTIGDFRFYKPVWKDAILAFWGYGEFSYGNVPWNMVARSNGTTLLRSYYEGRYEDDNLINVTLELRQRIWKRLGAVAWVGAGNFYSKDEPFSWEHTLSDIGLGLRWEFKRRVNLRVDYGFGRCGQQYLIFGIKEAF